MFQSSFFTVAFWLILFPVLWASGSFAGFRLREKNLLFSGILTLALGLGVYAYFLVAAGSLNWLKPEAAWFFLAFFLIFGWQKGKSVFRWLNEMFRFFWSTRDTFSRVCQWSLMGTFLLTALFCFLPEISNDALGIHLYLSKLFVRNASISPSLYDLISYRPLLMSVLYSTGLLFQNVAIAKLFHWFCGILFVSAAVIKAAEITQNKKTALFLGLMLWLTPTLMNQITTTYIDAGISLFIFLGYCVVIEAFDNFEPSHFFYGGLLIGLAVAIRSLSLGAFFAIMVMLSFRLFQRTGRKRVITAGIYFTLGTFLSSSYWFLRDWVYTGNPVYPYLGSLFGNEDLSYLTKLYFQELGLPRSPSSFLMIPWNLTFKPQYFDYHHWLGPFYLAVLPFVLYAVVKIKKARPHLQFVFFFIVFWYFTGQIVRYLLPIMPVYLITAAMGAGDLSKRFFQSRWWNFLAKTASCLVIASLLSLTAYHFRYQFMPLFQIWNSKEYLQKMERTALVAEWINQNLPQDAKILSLDEPHLFYFDREVILDVEFNVRTRYKSESSSEAIAAILKETGITHILDTEIRKQDLPIGYDNSNRPIDLILRDKRFAQPLTLIRSSNVIGRQCRYALYKLA